MPTLPDLTRELVAIRRKPGTEARFRSYPSLLKQFADELAVCTEVTTLREVIALDSGYYLLAGYRQQVLERWLGLERTAEALRLYANQLLLFGDVDDVGESNPATDARIEALEAEADVLDSRA